VKESIFWITTALPGHFQTVLTYCAKRPDHVWPGYYNKERGAWFYQNHLPIQEGVSAWAALPLGPENLPAQGGRALQKTTNKRKEPK
jgi:hypothetical protein